MVIITHILTRLLGQQKQVTIPESTIFILCLDTQFEHVDSTIIK